MQALKVDALAKSFGSRQAVRGISFEVQTGETVAFLGPNGAGKSTTLRMIAGFLEPDAGDALINGVSIISDRTKAQLAVGYLAEGAPLYLDLSARDFLGTQLTYDSHNGTDFAIPLGTVVVAAAPGVVLAQCLATGSAEFCSLVQRDRLGTLWALPSGFVSVSCMSCCALHCFCASRSQK